MKALTVRQLIEALKEEDPTAHVALSGDAEGNNFCLMPSEQYMLQTAYMKNTFRRQDNYIEESEYNVEGDTATDFYGNKYKKTDLLKCIVLWPSD